MNEKSLQAMDNDGLKLEARELDRQTGHETEYEALKLIPHGQFLLKELKLRKAYALACYKHIDPAHEHALVALMAIQSAEIEAEHWINRIENSGDRLEELNARRETLAKIAAFRKKEADSGPHFMPEALRKDRENDTRTRKRTDEEG